MWRDFDRNTEGEGGLYEGRMGQIVILKPNQRLL